MDWALAILVFIVGCCHCQQPPFIPGNNQFPNQQFVGPNIFGSTNQAFNNFNRGLGRLPGQFGNFLNQRPVNPISNIGGRVMGDTRYCQPGQNGCWPNIRDIDLLRRTLLWTNTIRTHMGSGQQMRAFPLNKKLLIPSLGSDMVEYRNLSIMKNIAETRLPAFIVRATNIFDVQNAVLFARQHAIKLSVLSSGHDYVGRSTGNNTLMIDLRGFNGINIRTGAIDSPTSAAADVDAGNAWGRVYNMVSQGGYILPGCNHRTVAVGGWTLGGGHGPLTRKLGLGADNVVSFTLVTPDGSIVKTAQNGTIVNDVWGKTRYSMDTGLFWALKGGGGGTFGVVTSITFKLHRQPVTGFVSLMCWFPMFHDIYEVGKSFIQYWLRLKQNLPQEWSGHLTTNSMPVNNTFNVTGYVQLNLLHHGGWQQALNFIRQIAAFRNARFGNRLASEFGQCVAQNRTSFSQYVNTMPQERSYVNTYVVNSLIPAQRITNQLIDSLLRQHHPRFSPGLNRNYIMSCTWTDLGGAVRQGGGVSAVSEHLRNAEMELTCAAVWFQPLSRQQAVTQMSQIGTFIRQSGVGSYINKPERGLSDWKQRYFGNNYQRLAIVKRAWDRDNYLSCNPCVGMDLPARITPVRRAFSRRVTNSATTNVIKLTTLIYSILFFYTCW